MFEGVLKHRSGRVIALARSVLAAVFLFAVWIDPTHPAQAEVATYTVLSAYVAAAVLLTLLTWDNWWLDGKLAAGAHAVDIAAFTLLVLATDGYTSPFFVFFVFLILSAAIRWGWRSCSAAPRRSRNRWSAERKRMATFSTPVETTKTEAPRWAARKPEAKSLSTTASTPR